MELGSMSLFESINGFLSLQTNECHICIGFHEYLKVMLLIVRLMPLFLLLRLVSLVSRVFVDFDFVSQVM